MLTRDHLSSRTGREGPVETGDRPSGRLLLVGAARELRRLAGCLEQAPLAGVPVIGYVDISGRARQLVVHPGSAPVPFLGRIDRLPEVVDRTGATDLLVAVRARSLARRRRQFARLDSALVRVHWADMRIAPAPSLLRSPPKWECLGPPWPLRVARVGKRLVDIIGAIVGLVVLAPFLAVVALLIWATSGGPIFYTQVRVGRGARRFAMIKFRSMRVDAESDTGPVWARTHDARCTGIGRWLRRYNIDELPQLWNVLMGDMSLVGPRPERPLFVDRFMAEVPEYDYRHAVPVGMTGWAQVHGWRGPTSLRKRLQYDLDYIRRWTFGLDLIVLAMTVQHVLWGKTRWITRPSLWRRAR